jgi:two-component system, NarL family, response regulator YdfI
MIRVLVVASAAAVQAGLEAILSRDAGMELVGRSVTLRSIADGVAEHEPDIVLIELPEGQTSDVLRLLPLLSVDADDGGRGAPGVVLLTDEREATPLWGALHAGVRALLRRDAAPNEIVAAVVAAAAGLVTIAPEWLDVAAPVRAATARAASPGAMHETPLSAREIEVLRMIADGLANKQIAARLGISEHTVKFHVASVFAKLHASTRAEAVMTGARRGMIVV